MRLLSSNMPCTFSGQSKAGLCCSTSANPSTRRRQRTVSTYAAAKEVTLLDYGAGNVRSVRNAIKKLGYTIKDVTSPADIAKASKLVFPGVGSYGQAMKILESKGYTQPLLDYINDGKPFLGICLGLQLLFEGSEENGGWEGLGLIPGQVRQFDVAKGLPVPHIGWNTLKQQRSSELLSTVGDDDRVYFVHSFRAMPSAANKDWVLATSSYGEDFIAAVSKGAAMATQFHPEKSGAVGLQILRGFLEPVAVAAEAAGAGAEAAQRSGGHASTSGSSSSSSNGSGNGSMRGLAKRVIACLDVRSNDQGDLVVTKGDQYDVREKSGDKDVRNLGQPVDLASRYFDEGADEVAFLNITGFRDCPLEDLPMLGVLQAASERVFVPLTVGGGIRGFTANGKDYSALEVASEYFRSGADKVSIGGDAVDAAEAYYARGGTCQGDTAIEQISQVYGKQAVVVSIDPRRVYVSSPSDTKHTCVPASTPGPNGEEWCWWQCTVKGGREGRELDAVALAKAVEALGAGEIMLNCIDQDGTNKGFDINLVAAVSKAVTIPVIASSGAGAPEHFTEVFQQTGAAAALAAGIFHRREVGIDQVKRHMADNKIPARI